MCYDLGKKIGIEVVRGFDIGMEEVSTKVKYTIPARKRNKFLSAFCFAPFYSFLVDWEGYVGPCMASTIRRNGENSLKERSLKEIWYGNFFSAVRKAMIEGKPESCDLTCNHCGINIQRAEMATKIQSYLQ